MDMRSLSIDIETFSSADLAKSGVYRYSELSDFDVILFSYSINHGPVIYKGNIFSGHIFCAECGSVYTPRVWNSNTKYRKTVWQCIGEIQKKKGCATERLTDEEIKSLAVKALNIVASSKTALVKTAMSIAREVYDNSALEAEAVLARREMEEAASLANDAVRENAASAIDQDEYERRYNAIIQRYMAAKNRLVAAEGGIASNNSALAGIRRYVEDVERMPDVVDSFDPEMFTSLIECMKVRSGESVTVRFMDGREVEVGL